MILDVEDSKHSVIQIVSVHNPAYVSLSDDVVSVESVTSASLDHDHHQSHGILVLLSAEQLRAVAIVTV